MARKAGEGSDGPRNYPDNMQRTKGKSSHAVQQKPGLLSVGASPPLVALTTSSHSGDPGRGNVEDSSTALKSPSLCTSRQATKRFPGSTGDRNEDISEEVILWTEETASALARRDQASALSSGYASSPRIAEANGQDRDEWGREKPLKSSRLAGRKRGWLSWGPYRDSHSNITSARRNKLHTVKGDNHYDRFFLRKVCYGLVCALLGYRLYHIIHSRYLAPSLDIHLPPQTSLLLPRTHPAWQPPFNWFDPPDRRLANATKLEYRLNSYYTPRHTREDLDNLPSRWDGEDTYSNDTDGPKAFPVTLVLDCTTSNHFSADTGPSMLNAFLQVMSDSRNPPSDIRILIEAGQGPNDPTQVYGYKAAWTTLHSIVEPGLNVAQSSTRQTVIQDLQAPFVLVTGCPAHSIESNTAWRYAEHISQLMRSFTRIALTDLYHNAVLATAGVKLGHAPSDRLSQKSDFITFSAEPADRITSTHIIETTEIDIPVSTAFFPSYLITQHAWKENYTGIDDSAALSATRRLPFASALAVKIRLASEFVVRIFGLPVVGKQGIGSHSFSSLTEALKNPVISDAVASFRQPAPILKPAFQTDTDSPVKAGSAARIAVLLQDIDYIHEWFPLICAFAGEQHHGHLVTIFSANGNGQLARLCHDVEVVQLSLRSLQSFSADICLAGANENVSHFARDCTLIALCRDDLGLLDWLPTLSLESLQNWSTPQIDLVVITNDRPKSLHRLLTSLRRAHYLDDEVNLLVNMEQTSDSVTTSMLSDSRWPFGNFALRHRIVLGGLMTSIVESWYPLNNDSYAVLLEDDVEVSPLFYAWVKFTILHYRYGSAAAKRDSRNIFGISLYQPKLLELHPDGRSRFDAHKVFGAMGVSRNTPYLSQIPCSWGALYTPEVWREFHQYLQIRLAETTMSKLELADPIVAHVRSNRWPRSWKRYMIELIHLRGYVMLYPNYADFRSLSTNHLELGTHVKDGALADKRRKTFEVPLLSEQDTLLEGLPGGRLPPQQHLPVLDFWGSLSTEEELLHRGRTTRAELELCESDELDDMDRPWRFDASELLCLHSDRSTDLEVHHTLEDDLQIVDLRGYPTEDSVEDLTGVEAWDDEPMQFDFDDDDETSVGEE